MLKNNLQQSMACSNHFSKVWKCNRIGQSNTPSISRDLEIKWNKVSWENLGICCLKINNGLMYCLGIGTLLWHLMDFVILSHWSECYLKLHIHKMGPRGPKNHFWQPVLIKKMPVSSDSMCFFIFLQENIYHSFSEFTSNSEFYTPLLWFPRDL